MSWGTNDMKKALYIIGAGLIISSAAAIYLLNKNKKEQSPVDDATLATVVPNQEEPVYEDVKSSAIGNMYSRQEGAATIIRNSVEAIRENVKVSENTNNEIDEVSAELDKMLSED